MTTSITTCDRKPLQQRLEHAACLLRAARKPILEHVQMWAGAGRLHLRVTDGELDLQQSFPCEGDLPVTLLPGRELLRRLRGSQAGLLSIQRHGTNCTLSAGNVAYQLSCHLDEADSPPTRRAASGSDFTITAADLHRGLAAVKPAMATRISRYAINGALLEPARNALRLVATDGRRLVYDTVGCQGPADAEPVILPAKLIELLLRLTRRSDSDVQLRVQHFPDGRAELQIHGDDWQLNGFSLEGRFPAYRDVVPKAGQRIEVPHKPLLELIESMADTRAASEDQIVLQAAGGELQLAVNNNGQLRSQATLPIEGNGPETPIVPHALNARYLRDVLRSLRSARIICDFGPVEEHQRLRPVQFLPADEDGMRWVVMPIYTSEPQSGSTRPAAA